MNQKPCFKTSVGGQALMEGIMMRGPHKICCAVRDPEGNIQLTEEPVTKHGWQKIPFVRGAIAMIDNLMVGYRYLMLSAKISMGEEFEEEEPTKFEQWIIDHLGEKAADAMLMLAAVVGGLIAIVLFTVLPTAIVGGIGAFVPLGRWARVVLEAILKVTVFVLYLWAASHMK